MFYACTHHSLHVRMGGAMKQSLYIQSDFQTCYLLLSNQFTPDYLVLSGFSNNWWVGLSLMHNIFTREHNSICDMLRTYYPEWQDQKLYDTARYLSAKTELLALAIFGLFYD